MSFDRVYFYKEAFVFRKLLFINTTIDTSFGKKSENKVSDKRPNIG